MTAYGRQENPGDPVKSTTAARGASRHRAWPGLRRLRQPWSSKERPIAHDNSVTYLVRVEDKWNSYANPSRLEARAQAVARASVGDGKNGARAQRPESALRGFTKVGFVGRQCRCSAGCPSRLQLADAEDSAEVCCGSRACQPRKSTSRVENRRVPGSAKRAKGDRFRQLPAKGATVRREQGRARRNRAAAAAPMLRPHQRTRAEGRTASSAGRGPIAKGKRTRKACRRR